MFNSVLSRTFIICDFSSLVRNYLTSALYITGQKAQTTCVTVKPYLDYDDRLKTENLEENLKRRGLSVNLKRLNGLWAMYKTLEEQKEILQVTRTEMGKLMTKLMKEEDKYRAEIQELRTKAKEVKNDFLNVRDYAYGVEESAACQVLNLPNILHANTPTEESRVIHSYSDKPEGPSKLHIELAKEKGLIEYISPMFYYLKDDAALFELATLNYVTDYLTQADYSPFANSDFSKSVVVEGCGVDFTNKHEVFTLDDPHDEVNHELCRLHLTGSGSLYSFMAYFTKHSLKESVLPLKCFSHGKVYAPVKNSEAPSLFNLTQYSVVRPFIATIDDDAALDKALQQIQQDVIKIYENLGQHFRLVLLQAKNLNKSESLRLSIQMLSNYLGEYVEVGHISVYDTYLSKRLLFVYEADKERKFPKVISGALFNLQKYLACSLENNSVTDRPLLTDLVKQYITS